MCQEWFCHFHSAFQQHFIRIASWQQHGIVPMLSRARQCWSAMCSPSANMHPLWPGIFPTSAFSEHWVVLEPVHLVRCGTSPFASPLPLNTEISVASASSSSKPFQVCVIMGEKGQSSWVPLVGEGICAQMLWPDWPRILNRRKAFTRDLVWRAGDRILNSVRFTEQMFCYVSVPFF